jgi:hypothetical protein
MEKGTVNLTPSGPSTDKKTMCSHRFFSYAARAVPVIARYM